MATSAYRMAGHFWSLLGHFGRGLKSRLRKPGPFYAIQKPLDENIMIQKTAQRISSLRWLRIAILARSICPFLKFNQS
ncbi:MAG TPA: hypothetical protein VFF11_14320, partial [Candidatus Binatia bacterium]|nr:hypothetical protein [Candidatus Binatia bacterium]